MPKKYDFKQLLTDLANGKRDFYFSWDKQKPISCTILEVHIDTNMARVKLSEPLKEKIWTTKDTPFGELSGEEEINVFEKWVRLP